MIFLQTNCKMNSSSSLWINSGLDSREVFDRLNQLQVSYRVPCEFSLSLSPQFQRFLYNAVGFIFIYIHILH